MIDLEKVKLAIFDFDDTLPIHTNHRPFTAEQAEDYHTRVLSGDITVWDSCLVSDAMYDFVTMCLDKGIRTGLMSATDSYVHMVLKHDWVLLKYGVDMENFCVGSSDRKAPMLEYIAKANNLDNNEILLVDDLYSTLESASNLGFQCASPIEVAAYMDASISL